MGSYSKYLHTKIKNNKDKKNTLLVIPIILFGVFLLYCYIRPQDTGILGKTINFIMMQVFGLTKFFIPFIIFYWVWYILESKKHEIKTKITLVLLLTLISSGLLKIILRILKLSNDKINYFSGWLGNFFIDVVERIFGEIFGSVIVILSFFYIITLLFEISLSEVFYGVYQNLIEDISNWLNEIKQKKKVVISASRYERKLKKMNNISSVNSKVEGQTIKKQKEEVSIKQHKILPQDNVSEAVETETEKKTNIIIKKSEVAEQKTSQYIFPQIDLLTLYKKEDISYNLEQQAKKLEEVLKEFDIDAKVVNISVGPVVTMYEIELEPGIKVQSVSALRDNIALGMKASSIRIIAPLPSKGTIGIEIPNPRPQIVSLREILESEEYKELSKKMELPIVLGKTVDGKPYIDDIVPMPHLLIAGSTGSGKSVCLHSIIVSLLYRCHPDYVKFVLIDPKRLELMHYNGIPHLYDPSVEPQNVKVITSSKEAAKVLSLLVKVMEQRYEKFASANVRNIEGYNNLMKSKNLPPEFYIVVIIDEFADLILTVPKEVEEAIQRLAQMARAVGIHLILATQRPSVDVITGVIKANFSSRIAFQVLSKTDSRVILDITGAEELLGRGDMLYLPTGAPKPIRLQGAFVSDKDIINVVNFIKSQNLKPNYEPIVKSSVGSEKILKERELEQKEDLYSALLLIKERRRVSQDLLKAHFRSSSKATDILSLLEVKGFIYKPEGTNRWSINFDRVEEALKSYEKQNNVNFNIDANNN
jgi:S-DNA-T family DNA segregation ATPase FtsK/SpoIIIE